jgi:NADPH2:quinone reductase
MRAAWFESFGSAEDAITVGEQPKPTPQAGEVLINLKTSGVNPSDVKKRAGAFPSLLDDGLVIPHSDGAGIIEAVGEGVPESRVGERVWIYQAQFGRRFGTAADYVALDSSRAAILPDSSSFEVGACLGIPTMTAHRCVFADGPVEGQTVLITGGAGRVGSYALQLARVAGANVIATASSGTDEVTCRDLGAAHVVNHRESNWGDQVLEITQEAKVDRVIDVEFGANLPEVLKCIRTGGIIATYSSTQVREPQLPFLKMMFMDLTVRMVIVYAMPESAKQDAIKDINRSILDNRLQHRIAHVLPLPKTAHAHQLIEQNHTRGCVVLDLEE